MEQDKDPVERTNLKCKSSPLFFYLLAAFIFWFLFHSSSNLFCTIVFTNLIHLYSEEDCWLTAVDLWSCDYLLWLSSRIFSFFLFPVTTVLCKVLPIYSYIFLDIDIPLLRTVSLLSLLKSCPARVLTSGQARKPVLFRCLQFHLLNPNFNYEAMLLVTEPPPCGRDFGECTLLSPLFF